MKTKLVFSGIAVVAICFGAAEADRPRVFITESLAMQLSGDASAGDARGSMSFTGGTSPQHVEVLRAFTKYCPEMTVTSNREKADFVIRLDHEGVSPTTPFVRGNKVAVFNKNEYLIHSRSTRLLRNSVRGACAAVTGSPRKK